MRAEYVLRMKEKRDAYTILVKNPERKGPLRRPIRGWKNNVLQKYRENIRTGFKCRLSARSDLNCQSDELFGQVYISVEVRVNMKLWSNLE
jgi:hypothetical protein